VKKSDIDTFESYLDSYLKFLRKFSKNDWDEKDNKKNIGKNKINITSMQIKKNMKVQNNTIIEKTINKTDNSTSMKEKNSTKKEQLKEKFPIIIQVNQTNLIQNSTKNKIKNETIVSNTTKEMHELNSVISINFTMSKQNNTAINNKTFYQEANNSTKVINRMKKNQTLPSKSNPSLNRSTIVSKIELNITEPLIKNNSIIIQNTTIFKNFTGKNKTSNKNEYLINATNETFNSSISIDSFMLSNIEGKENNTHREQENHRVPAIPRSINDSIHEVSKEEIQDRAQHKHNNISIKNKNESIFTNSTIKISNITQSNITVSKIQNKTIPIRIQNKTNVSRKGKTEEDLEESSLDKIYSHLKTKALNEEFERAIETEVKRKEKLFLYAEDAEYNIYKRIINISLSLIVTGLLMGILIGLILVMYLNSKS
jgi:hypothetical protein